MSDVVTLWSRTSDFSAVVADFPCVTDKALWDSEADATKFYGTNGTYIQSDNTDSSTLTDQGGGTWTLDMASTTGVLVGMYAYIDDYDGGPVGYYRVNVVDSSTRITIAATNLVGSNLIVSDTVSFYIGGISDAFDGSTTLQAEFDAAGTDYADSTNNVDILCHASTATTLTATLDMDSITGSTTTRVRVTGTNASFVNDGTRVELTTAVTLANGLMDFNVSGASKYVEFANIFYNGGGVGLAEYCVNESDVAGLSDFINFNNCIFRDADSDGVNHESDEWQFHGCDFLDNGKGGTGHGLNTNTDGFRTIIDGCRFISNASDGVLIATGCTVTNSIFAFNTIGLCVAFNQSDNNNIFNNTFYFNISHGMEIQSGSTQNAISNNASEGNGTGGTGYGYMLNSSTPGGIGFFGYNSSFGDADGPSNLATTDAEFQALFSGFNTTVDTSGQWESTTTTDADFLRPKSTSSLLNTGAGQFTQDGFNKGALSPIAGGGTGGGSVNLFTGLLG